MRNKILILITLCVFFLFLKFNVSAQVATSEVEFKTSVSSITPSSGKFEASYKEYVNFMEKYNKVHAEYVVAKSQYIRTKSLSAETQALKSGIQVIIARDDVIIGYLKMKKTRLEEAVGVNESTISLFGPRISEEVLWYENHKLRTGIINNLSDLTSVSRDAEGHYESTKRLYNEVLLYIPFGRVKDYQERLDNISLSFHTRLNEAKADQREEYKLSMDKTQKIDTWLTDFDMIIDKSDEKISQADESILSRKLSGEGLYNAVLQSSMQSTDYMKNAIYRLMEIINEMKTK